MVYRKKILYIIPFKAFGSFYSEFPIGTWAVTPIQLQFLSKKEIHCINPDKVSEPIRLYKNCLVRPFLKEDCLQLFMNCGHVLLRQSLFSNTILVI